MLSPHKLAPIGRAQQHQRLALGLSLLLLLLSPLPALSADQDNVLVMADQLTHLALTVPVSDMQHARQQLLATSRLSRDQQAQVWHRVLMNLRQEWPTASAQWLVADLAAAPALTLAPHPEGPGLLVDPQGISAAAHGTVNAWSWRLWSERMARDPDPGRHLDILTKMAASTRPVDQAGLRGAAAGLASNRLNVLNQAPLTDALAARPELAPLALSVAQTTGNARFLIEAMNRWPQDQQAAAILRLDQWLPMDQAINKLTETVSTNNPQASFAKTTLRRLSQDPTVPPALQAQIAQTLDRQP